MVKALGRLPQGYFSFHFPGEFREVTEEEAARILPIKGITRARVPDRSKLQRYLPHYQEDARPIHAGLGL